MFAPQCPACAHRPAPHSSTAPGAIAACPSCFRPVADAPLDVAAETPAPPVRVWEPAAVRAGAAVAVVAEDINLDMDPVPLERAVPSLERELPPERTGPPTARPPRGPTSRRPFDGDAGRVILNPTGLFAVDLAAELSATLSLRMAPPPEPVSDRQLTMAAWLTGVAVAGVLWLVAVLTAPGLFPFVALVGAAMVAFGCLWRAYLAGRGGNPTAGLVTLLPPVAAVRLFAPTPTHGLRPLRFVLAGAVFLGLFVLGPAVRSVVEGAIGTRIDDIPLDGPTAESRLRKAIAAKRHDEIVSELRQLPRPDGVTADERTGIVRELVALTGAERGELRAAALTALADWSPTEAKAAARAGLVSTDGDERRAACRVADRVLGTEAAAGLAACLTDREDRPDAKAALIRLGAVAEESVLPLLASDREPVALVACEVLERVGGPNAVAALRGLAETTKSRAVRQDASQAAEAIGERLRRPR